MPQIFRFSFVAATSPLRKLHLSDTEGPYKRESKANKGSD